MPKNLQDRDAPPPKAKPNPIEEEREPEDAEEDEEADDEPEGEPEADKEEESGGDSAEEPAKEDKPGEAAAEEESEDAGTVDPEERRARRRQEKKERRERARNEREFDKSLIKSLTKQLQEVNTRVSAVETHGLRVDVRQIDESIQSAGNAYRIAEHKMQEAMTKQNGAAFTAALRARDEARDRYQQLSYQKTTLEKSDRPQRPTIDPVVMNHAKSFTKEHKWYDPQGRDRDSRIMLAIDKGLVDAGFDPTTAEYWKELRKQGREAMPQRFKSQQSADGRAEGGVVKKTIQGRPRQLGNGAQIGGVRRGGPVLSKDRREAMTAMGLEPGTKKWDEMVREYQSYDKSSPRKN